MSAHRLSDAGLPASDAQRPIDASDCRQDVLRDIEAALTSARMAADAIDCRTLAYFIDTAIVELKSTMAEA